jgi:hypothetical protein
MDVDKVHEDARNSEGIKNLEDDTLYQLATYWSQPAPKLSVSEALSSKVPKCEQ